MNNYYVMTITQDDRKRKSEAGIITAGFIAFFILCMILLKWKIPVFIEKAPEQAIEVELVLPDEPPPPPLEDGGGGGGNEVKAAGAPGIAKYSPPPPGEPSPSKAVVDENDDNKESPAIPKHAVVKPEATKTVTSSVTKTPKPEDNPPAPKPKAVMANGKYISGTNTGGNEKDGFEKAGGHGNGSGVGTGNGTGGGNGNGFGGGNGNGGGTGSGPKIVRGDRRIVRSYSFDGDLDKAVIYANVSVSPEGVGRFISIAKGSSNSSNAYKEAIIRYLANIKFDKADHESMLTVQFNFMVN